jgi:hypothetical protein
VDEIGPAEKAEDDAEDEALEASPTPGVDGLGYDLEGNALGVPGARGWMELSLRGTRKERWGVVEGVEVEGDAC